MLNLIPTNQTKKNQADNEDLSDSMILPSSPFKKNSFFTIGFQANPEDNAERKAKVRDFLSEFQVQLQRLQDKDSPLSLRDKIKEDSEAIHAALDNIFCLFNVDIQLVKQDQSDSACRIEPVIHLGKAIQCLFYIALALSKFPYSFIKIIDLNKFTICKKAQLKSEGYQDVFLARMMTNATFMTEVHGTYEKVEAQFYKVVIHHVIKKVPSIHTEWPIDKSPRQSPRRNDTRFFTFTQSQLNDKFTRAGSPTRTTSPTRTMSPSRTILSPDKTKQKESLEEVKVKERTETFYRLMSNPGYADQASDPRESLKARFLKDKLEFLDPIGVCEEWWDSLLVSDFVVLEKSDGDFAVKRQINK